MVVPPLPVEITKHIIKQSLPPLQFDTFMERYRILRTFSLVDSRWWDLAQKERGKHVMLSKSQVKEMRDTTVQLPSFFQRSSSLWTAPFSQLQSANHDAICRILETYMNVADLFVGSRMVVRSCFYSAAHRVILNLLLRSPAEQ
jgi:hypothetical protein